MQASVEACAIATGGWAAFASELGSWLSPEPDNSGADPGSLAELSGSGDN